MQIASAGVVGLGTMGAGIAEVLARAGLPVTAVEVDDAALERGRGRLTGSLDRAVSRGRLAADDRDAALAAVTFTTSRGALAPVDLVVEAVPERLDAKLALVAELDRICRPDAVLATNTSSLPVTRIAAASTRPERVVGLHFFNPAPVMRLVEVVHTVATAPPVLEAVTAVAERCGKAPVVVADRVGFVANYVLFGYLNAAASAAETQQATVADIDRAMVAATGLPMGPLRLLDLIGLDVAVDILDTLHDETRDQRYAVAPRLRRLVMAGRLGRKTGSGWYDDSSAAGEPVAGGVPDADVPGGVVLVGGAGESRLAQELSRAGVPSVGLDEVGEATVVVVDGPHIGAIAERVARVSGMVAPGAVVAVACVDDAPVATAAAVSGRPADVVGLHLPLAPRPGVVEVVRTSRTRPAAVDAVVAALDVHGLVPVAVRDRPGLLVESLLLPHLADAVRVVDDRYATREDVETAMTLGCGYADGPFAMLDAIGPDDVRSHLLHLAAATHLSAYAPTALLDELAAFGTS